jgi:hypothetical protein
MANAHHSLDSVQIPRGMRWVDEFGDWAQVERAHAYGLTGALLIDVAERQAGRPITLQASNDQGWISRSTLQSLRAMAEAGSDTDHTLTHADGRVFTVRFAPGGAPVTATPVGSPEVPAGSNQYVATVRLVEVPQE